MDNMIRAIDKKRSFRIFAVRTTDLIEKARQYHNTSPTASAALGRTLTAGLLMGYMMKSEDNKLTLKINGGGPLGTILVTADNKGNIKGYVDNPKVDVPLKSNGKLDVGKAVGTTGKLTVIKDLGLKEPYVGSTDIVTGEIGEDITLYYFISEQQSSAVGLGVLVNRDCSIKSGGGFIIQVLPNIDNEDLELLEKTTNELKSISKYFDNNKSIEEVIKEMFKKFEIEITEKIPVQFKCDCSTKRMEEALITIGKEELKKIIDEDGEAEIVCHFCNKKYNFNKEQLENLLNNAV